MVKFLNFFIKLFNSRKSWNLPKQKPILIFDSTSSEVIKDFFNEDIIEILSVRGEILNIQILIRSLISKGNLKFAYIDAYIKAVKPKFIITLIDNSLEFYDLKYRHPEVKTVLIQNGVRSYYHDIFEKLDNLSSDFKSRLQVDYILSFGEIIGLHYKKYLSGKVIPIGSIKNNKIINKKNNKIKNTLTFISQWHEAGHLDLNCDHSVVSFLDRYSNEMNKDLRIIPRNKKNSLYRDKEDLFYKNIFGNDIPYTEIENLSSYDICDISDVTVGIDSTLCYENLARENKTAIFSIRSDILNLPGFEFNWPANFSDQGVFWTNLYDEAIFTKILNRLYEINDKEWKNCLNDINFNKSLIYDKNNLLLKNFVSQNIQQDAKIL